MNDPVRWSREQAEELYNVPHWGGGLVSITGDGHVALHPQKDPEHRIDVKALVDEIRQRGIQLPLLLRFTDVLTHRVREMNQAFTDAIETFSYEGKYVGVYPIKTNQERHVVEEYLEAGKELGFGLECGSKPELLAVLALTHEYDSLIVCNGFKDTDYLGMVLFAQKMGKKVIPVVEKFSELEIILELAKKLDVRPMFGVRVKLASRGSGRWKMTGGDRSKFGLTVTELIAGLEILEHEGLTDGLRLLHFHLGSQITNIHAIKNALTEVTRIYSELRGRCERLDYLDVGGGLGVDYDGSQTNFESSMNYTLLEYARDVIFRVKTVCDEADVPHPTIVTEAGRATVAYHSALVFDVVGVSSSTAAQVDSEELDTESAPPSLLDLAAICREVSEKNLLESYHDAVQAYEELLHAFKLGFLTLEQRSTAERLYYQACHKILRIVRTLDYVPDDLAHLEDQLADIYFCNFSIFQSLPDSWAIKQIFPILPLHRHLERPTRRGILADITCDSDGKIDRFIDLRDVSRTLPLHTYRSGEDYYLAAFLVGAYQEILGDLHNLFGDTNCVHVSIDEQGTARIDQVVKGDSVQDVLTYVQYSPKELLHQVRKDVELALRSNRITLDESARFLRFYETSLTSYTYLNARARAGDGGAVAPDASSAIVRADVTRAETPWNVSSSK